VLIKKETDVIDWLELSGRNPRNTTRVRKKAKLFVLDEHAAGTPLSTAFSTHDNQQRAEVEANKHRARTRTIGTRSTSASRRCSRASSRSSRRCNLTPPKRRRQRAAATNAIPSAAIAATAATATTSAADDFAFTAFFTASD
jgi:hypothetical protein